MNASDGNPLARWFLVELFFPKRIGPGSYFIRSCAVWVLTYGLILGSRPLLGSELIASALLLLTAYVYFLLCVVLPRMRDLWIHPFWLILTLVPILNRVFGFVLAFRKPIWSFAREWYEKAANAGDMFAMHNLGVLYEVAKDYAKAREWYQKAAAAGDTSAMKSLGVLYESGRGVAQDYAKAHEWYQKAAAAGDTFAMNNLGVLYDKGHGVAQDYAKAREWYQKAAAGGSWWSSFSQSGSAGVFTGSALV